MSDIGDIDDIWRKIKLVAQSESAKRDPNRASHWSGSYAPVGEASPSGGQAGAPVRAPAALETGPPCHLCRGRNMLRAWARVYFCQRCKAATALTLSGDGWKSYGTTLTPEQRDVVLHRTSPPKR